MWNRRVCRWSAHEAGARKGNLKFALEKYPLYVRSPHLRFPCSAAQQVQASRWNIIEIKESNEFLNSEGNRRVGGHWGDLVVDA